MSDIDRAIDGTGIRCPECRALDWYRDGFAIWEHEDGTLERQRLTASADQATRWSCAQCAYEVPEWTVLDRSLRGAQVAHED